MSRIGGLLGLAVVLLSGVSSVVSAQSSGAGSAGGAGNLAQAAQAAQAMQAAGVMPPELAALLRQRVGGTGLTPGQLRARLGANGLSGSLLDGYLPGSTPGAGQAVASDSLFLAVSQLGLADSTEIKAWRAMAGLPPTPHVIDQRAFRRRPAPAPVVPKSALLTARYDTLPTRTPAVRVEDTVQLTVSDSARIAADSGFNIFGLEVFRRAGETPFVEPLLSGPVDGGYRLGIGDHLAAILSGDVEATYTLQVDREGMVVLPNAGPISIASLTMDQATQAISAHLGRVLPGLRRDGSGRTRLTLSVTKVRTNQVFVTGDVARPGSVQLASTGTALTALYAAGGPTESGSMRQILVRRRGIIVATLDLYDYLLHGDARGDVRLEQGDVVFVAPHGARVRIYGEVLRPATYELQPYESITSLLRNAGGLTPSAATRRIAVERVVPARDRRIDGRDRITFDITLGDAASEETPLVGGDVVHVLPVLATVRNAITVVGHVWTTGTQGWLPGTMLSTALRRAGGVKPDAYLGAVLVSRLRPDSTRTLLRTALADASGTPTRDIALEEGDEIHVFQTAIPDAERTVGMAGAVATPGRYKYHTGMTLRDLIWIAGGMAPDANLDAVEIVRFPSAPTSASAGVTVMVPLDSSYLAGHATTGAAAEFELQPYDQVLLAHRRGDAGPRSVVLTGQVRRPGRYVLAAPDERLASVITRAGGILPTADAHAISVVRAEQNQGKIGIDGAVALEGRTQSDNLILADQDSIDVAPFRATVTVTGAVHHPTTLAYVPGQSLKGYINMAGGATIHGDASRAWVQQPGGRVESMRSHMLWFDGNPTPLAGAVVVVPETDPLVDKGSVANLTALSQILGTLVTVFAVLHK